MDNENDIGRFLEAQADRWSGYDIALSEIRNGRKVSHWIWYVFPQLRGLDVMKVQSSMTLFDCILLNDVFRRVLELFYGGRVIPIR